MKTLTDHIVDLAAVFADHIPAISEYAFGYSYPKDPRDDDGNPIPVAVFINNGLCHVFAKLVAVRVPGASVVGHPSHVWLEQGGLHYDACYPQGVERTVMTRYPDMLLDYGLHQTVLREFPHYSEALHSMAWLAQTEWADAYRVLCDRDQQYMQGVWVCATAAAKTAGGVVLP